MGTLDCRFLTTLSLFPNNHVCGQGFHQLYLWGSQLSPQRAHSWDPEGQSPGTWGAD
jgi:hypothetical protein